MLEFIKKYKDDIILIIGVILISLFSFSAGYLYSNKEKKCPILIESIIDEETFKRMEFID